MKYMIHIYLYFILLCSKYQAQQLVKMGAKPFDNHMNIIYYTLKNWISSLHYTIVLSTLEEEYFVLNSISLLINKHHSLHFMNWCYMPNSSIKYTKLV